MMKCVFIPDEDYAYFKKFCDENACCLSPLMRLATKKWIESKESSN